MLASEQCPGSDELASFQHGLVEGERIDAIGEHIEDCLPCRRKLLKAKDIDPLEQGLRQESAIETETGYRQVVALANRWSVEHTQERSREKPRIQPPEAGALELGRLGHYRILRELGEGAMAYVYEAEDTRLHRLVALKVLKPYWARTETARKRFLLEARASANLVGDSIVPIFDVGESEGVPFLAMALLRGETLESRLSAQGRLPLPSLVQYARQIAVGLKVAHDHGLIHRDLKPANLWIEANSQATTSGTLPALQRTTTSAEAPLATPELTIKILDFGLARCIREDSRITQSGMVVGTPAYMAPEQARGDEVDVRSDLFSLGCILYRMATGELPFQGKDTLAVFWALASKNPVPPDRLNSEVPAELSALIMRLLAKKPEKRPASAEAVLAELNRLPSKRQVRSHWWKFGIGAALSAALLFFLTNGLEPDSGAGIADPQGTIDLTPLLAVPVAPNPRGTYLFFDGNARVDIPDFPFPANGPYTLEAYATVMEKSTRRQVLIGSGAECRITALEISSYRRPFPTWRFSWLFPRAIGEAHAAPNQRFHLAAVFDNKEATLFVNGKKDVSVVPPSVMLGEDPITLQLGYCFVGRMEQVRISRGIRYREEFLPEPLLSADGDTLGVYHFDDEKGEILHDRSGNNRHGTILGAVWKSP